MTRCRWFVVTTVTRNMGDSNENVALSYEIISRAFMNSSLKTLEDIVTRKVPRKVNFGQVQLKLTKIIYCKMTEKRKSDICRK